MISELMEVILGRIMGVIFHPMEKLTAEEVAAMKNFSSNIKVVECLTKSPVIVAMIGLVGSGKSFVARYLARRIGGTVIEGDAIRVELRKQDAPFERTRVIAEEMALEVIRRGGNAILDSDFIDAKKRASLREKARKVGVQVLFVCTYCDIDVMIGRALGVSYRDSPDDFFEGAASLWKEEETKGAVVKIREMLRRLPLHYSWEKNGGGKWKIKNPPCTVIADIETTDSRQCRLEVARCGEKIISKS